VRSEVQVLSPRQRDDERDRTRACPSRLVSAPVNAGCGRKRLIRVWRSAGRTHTSLLPGESTEGGELSQQCDGGRGLGSGFGRATVPPESGAQPCGRCSAIRAEPFEPVVCGCYGCAMLGWSQWRMRSDHGPRAPVTVPGPSSDDIAAMWNVAPRLISVSVPQFESDSLGTCQYQIGTLIDQIALGKCS
jgi:hypothetical protein